MLLELGDVALITTTCELARLSNRVRLGDVDVVFDVGTDGAVAKTRRSPLEALELGVEDFDVLDVAEQLAVSECVLDNRRERGGEITLTVANLEHEVVELLLATLAFEAFQDLLEFLLDRLVAFLKACDERRSVVVLAGREVDDRPNNVGLRIERPRKVGRLDRMDVAECARVVAGHEVRPGLLEQRIEPVLAADVDEVPMPNCGVQLLVVDLRNVVLIEPD